MSGGSEANKSGLTWEAWVKTLAEKQNFSVRNYSLRAECSTPIVDRRIVWTHAPYKTIFHNTKKPRKTSTEYLVECGTDLVRIECKWQGVSGSVDEKYPFMYLNAALTMTEDTVVFALGGEYFEHGKGDEVREWLRNVCAEPPDWFSNEIRERLKQRELLVLTTNTFAKWFRERFPSNGV
jgi:PD-(D/E)XK nuclease superfamily domain